MSYKYWDKDDEDFLIENYETFGAQYCAEILNRTVKAIRKKARKCDLSIVYWTEEELKFLKEHYSNNGGEYCKKALNKSLSSIYHKAEKLNLYSNIKGTGSLTTPCSLYIFWVPSEQLYKVGISSSPNRRVKELGVPAEILFCAEIITRVKAKSLESQVLEKVVDYRENTEVLKSGNSETFRLPIQELDSFIKWLNQLTKED